MPARPEQVVVSPQLWMSQHRGALAAVVGTSAAGSLADLVRGPRR